LSRCRAVRTRLENDCFSLEDWSRCDSVARAISGRCAEGESKAKRTHLSLLTVTEQAISAASLSEISRIQDLFQLCRALCYLYVLFRKVLGVTSRRLEGGLTDCHESSGFIQGNFRTSLGKFLTSQFFQHGPHGDWAPFTDNPQPIGCLDSQPRHPVNENYKSSNRPHRRSA
jgi:hypothetical protein